MTSEENLLQAALADPADDVLLLAYADWLEEQGEASAEKATFLRLAARLRRLPADAAPEVRARLQQLAARLEPEWLAVVSRLDVENCAERRKAENVRFPYFAFQCDRSWDRMQPTGDVNVRLCTSCQEKVYYCDTIVTARHHAHAGHCIAVDLGIIRRKNDVYTPVPIPGFPSAQWWAEYEEQMRVDDVSAEREARKKAKEGERHDQ